MKDRLAIDATLRTGSRGQFDVTVDGETLVTRGGNAFTRRFGAGYPSFDDVISRVQARLGSD
jgi:hypothetical protein